MSSIFGESRAIGIKQVREMLEIAIGWETANKYALLDESGNKVGFAAERKNGFLGALSKNFFKSHRPLTIDIWDESRTRVYIGRRPFYFFFSDLRVETPEGKRIGEIKTRFGIIKRKYDLIDSHGKVMARIESPRWRLWTFFIKDHIGADAGRISKKWGGAFNEIFSDSDTFALDLSLRPWSDDEKALLLFSALCIDLDFFEENSSSVLDLFD